MTATMSRPLSGPSVDVPAENAIPMSRLVRVEWSKATDTRSARWLIAVSALVTVAIMLLPTLRTSIDQTYVEYLKFAALGVSLLLPVVAIMLLTSEWTQRSVLSTFVQEPRRDRVITAKVLVALVMTAAAVVAAALVCLVAVLVVSASGRDVANDLGTVAVLGFVLNVLLNMLQGVAFGAALHNTAAAVVLFFVLPTAVGIIGGFVSWVNDWLNISTTADWVESGQWHGHVPQILVSVLLWVAAPLVVGLVRTARREIK